MMMMCWVVVFFDLSLSVVVVAFCESYPHCARSLKAFRIHSPLMKLFQSIGEKRSRKPHSHS